MSYYLFQTEQDAISADLQIVQNVYQFALQNVPERVSEAPLGLFGYNAKTGALVTNGGLTTNWAKPTECEEGWVIPVPYDIPPMTGEQMSVGISADIVEAYTPIETGEDIV